MLHDFSERLRGWFFTPVSSPMRPFDWMLLCVFLLTVAFLWSRVMRVLQDTVGD